MNLENTKLPDFTLKNQDGTDVSSKDYRGKKLVIYFYPKDDTPGCTLEAKGFRDKMSEFEALNTIVFGISKDDGASHCKFIEKYQLNFQLLSDPDLEVAKLLQAHGEKFSFGKLLFGLVRSSLVVDEEGKIIKHYEKISSTAGHPQEVLDFIKSYK